MKKIVLVTLALAGLALAGCASTPIKGKNTGGGSLYSDVQFNERASDNMVGGKRGESCASNVLGIIATGDASAATAAKSAGITKIATVDGTATNVLSFWAKYCVVVSGE
jgi:hypothetical protein